MNPWSQLPRRPPIFTHAMQIASSSREPSIPPIFEGTILFSAFAAVFGMFAINKLPQFYHPVFNYERFGVATDDRYLLVVEASDPKFDIVNTQRLLESLGAKHTEVVEA